MATQILAGLDPHEYGHPLDEQALDALQQIPGFTAVASAFMKHGLERFFTIQYTGSNLQITDGNCAKLMACLREVCATIALDNVPKLYIEWDDAINAHTVGSLDAILVLSSGCVDRLTDPELRFVIGHECGHIKSLHGQYYSLAQSATFLGELMGDYTFGVGKLVSQPLEFGLLRWSRFSELSCDRAGLLSCQDMTSAMSVLTKMAGLPTSLSEKVFHDSFLEQAKSFEAMDFDKASKLFKIASNLGRTHPWTVLRASELLGWIDSGQYDAVLRRESARFKHVKRLKDGEFCRNCNYRLKGAESFCPSCGQSLTA